MTWPPRITSSVGIAWTAKRSDSFGASSTLTLTSLTSPARSVATCSSAGLTIRHGPHQGAHRSTSTGTAACSATSAKVSSPASAIHGSGLWQMPQRGVPEAAAGTRLVRPQFGHLISREAMSGLVLVGHCEFAFRVADPDDDAGLGIAAQQCASDKRLHFPCDKSAQRACALYRIEAMPTDETPRLLGDLAPNLPLAKPG